MQTFLPVTDYSESASILDSRRLNKQILETFQIWSVLSFPFKCPRCGSLKLVDKICGCGNPVKPRGYRNHPAIKMWKGFEGNLIVYGFSMALEWKYRGNDHDYFNKFVDISRSYSDSELESCPPWLGHEPLHSSHRIALLSKDIVWYSGRGWLKEEEIVQKKDYVYDSKKILYWPREFNV